MKVIIDRNHWDRGKSGSPLYLKENDSFCAMGCLLNQIAGIDKEDLHREGWPGDAIRRVYARDKDGASKEIKEFWEKYYRGKSTVLDIPIFHKIMKVNDDPFLTEDRREYKLKVLFKELGIHLVIKDGE